MTIDSTIVVKIGGSILSNDDTTFQDLVTLQERGISTVVIHGGGPTISAWMHKLGNEPRFVRGLRITDAESMDIVAATLGGLVNKTLVSTLQKLGGRAVGLSGIDGRMLQGTILDTDLGYVGKISSVDTTLIQQTINSGFIPIIAPMATHIMDASDEAGKLLNINGDTAAGEIAKELGADSLVFMTDVEGIMNSSNEVISKIDSKEGYDLIQSGTVAGGMIPKLEACLNALENVNTAQIIDGRKTGSLLALVDGNSFGTKIV